MAQESIDNTFFAGEQPSFRETIESLLPVITKTVEYKPDFTVTGDNKEKVALILKKVLSYEISNNEKSFLSKVLAAIKLDINNILIITSKGLTYREIDKQFEFKKCIVSGFSPSELQMNINAPLYKPVKIDQQKILFIDHLELLENDTSKKKLLWDALQIMFNIK